MVLGGSSHILVHEEVGHVSLGANFTCAVLISPSKETGAKGRLFSWGGNDRGQLGHGNSKDRNIPTEVVFMSPSGIIHVTVMQVTLQPTA